MAAHIAPGNDGPRATPAAEWRFLRHPEYHRPVTPASGSWVDPVGRPFARSTGPRIRREVLTSVPQPERATADDLADHNKAQASRRDGRGR